MDQISESFLTMPLLSIIPYILGYIDPGSGSIIVQAAIAAAAGIALVVRLYWDRLLTFLRIRKDDKTDISENHDPEEIVEDDKQKSH